MEFTCHIPMNFDEWHINTTPISFWHDTHTKDIGIYCFRDMFTNEIYYVGKSTAMRNRMTGHLGVKPNLYSKHGLPVVEAGGIHRHTKLVMFDNILPNIIDRTMISIYLMNDKRHLIFVEQELIRQLKPKYNQIGYTWGDKNYQVYNRNEHTK